MSQKQNNLHTSEAAEQKVLFNWAELNVKKYPELELMYHIPNEGKRSKAVGAEFRRLGLKPGVPDICLPVAHCGFHGLYIEMKAGNNTPTEKQVEWLDKLRRAGHYTTICWGFEEAQLVIEAYLQERIKVS